MPIVQSITKVQRIKKFDNCRYTIEKIIYTINGIIYIMYTDIWTILYIPTVHTGKQYR